jgi:hypothetical protein
MHGRKEEEKKLKGGKRNTEIKAKDKCKSNASQCPVLTEEFVVAVTGESASKLLLVILKLIFLLSVPNPVK